MDGSSILESRFFLLNETTALQSLKNSAVTELWIDTSKGIDLPADVASEDFEQVQARAEAVLQSAVELQPFKTVAMSDEIQRALGICERSKHAVISMFTEVRMGNAIDINAADELVSEMTESILRHPSALLSLVRLKKMPMNIPTCIQSQCVR